MGWLEGALSSIGGSAAALVGIDGSQNWSNSENSAWNSSYQQANNYADSMSRAYSDNDAAAAREWAERQATIAFERQKELMTMEMEYNAEQAKIARDWNETMANTVYTRSVANMKEAGINPVLAANMGLSAASVGSGATASIGGQSAPLAQGFSGSSSASWSDSHSEGHERAGSSGGSRGTSTSYGESGTATGLRMLADLTEAAYIDSTSAEQAEKLKESFINGVIDALPVNFDKPNQEYSSGGHSF